MTRHSSRAAVLYNNLKQFVPSEKTPQSSFFPLRPLLQRAGDVRQRNSRGGRRQVPKSLVSELARSQGKEGNWDDATFGSEYGTATACVILQWQRRIEL